MEQTYLQPGWQPRLVSWKPKPKPMRFLIPPPTAWPALRTTGWMRTWSRTFQVLAKGTQISTESPMFLLLLWLLCSAGRNGVDSSQENFLSSPSSDVKLISYFWEWTFLNMRFGHVAIEPSS